MTVELSFGKVTASIGVLNYLSYALGVCANNDDCICISVKY